MRTACSLRTARSGASSGGGGPAGRYLIAVRRTRPHCRQVCVRRPARSRVRTDRPSTQKVEQPRQYTSLYSRSSRTLYLIPILRARSTYRCDRLFGDRRASVSARENRSWIRSWAARIIAAVRRPRRPRRREEPGPRIRGRRRRRPISRCCNSDNASHPEGAEAAEQRSGLPAAAMGIAAWGRVPRKAADALLPAGMSRSRGHSGGWSPRTGDRTGRPRRRECHIGDRLPRPGKVYA